MCTAKQIKLQFYGPTIYEGNNLIGCQSNNMVEYSDTIKWCNNSIVKFEILYHNVKPWILVLGAFTIQIMTILLNVS